MKGPAVVFVFLLMGQIAYCIDFRTSTDVLNVTSESTNFNMSCSVNESNIHSVLFIKLYVESSFGDSVEKLIPKIIAVATSAGTSVGKDLPTTLLDAVVSGHLNNTYTSDSRLQVGYNFTTLPCGFYSIVFTCEMSYLDMINLDTLTIHANETLEVKNACNEASTAEIGEGLLSRAGYVHHWVLVLVGLTVLNLLL